MRINSGINLDDVAYIAVLTAAVASISLATVAFLGQQAWAADPVADGYCLSGALRNSEGPGSPST